MSPRLAVLVGLLAGVLTAAVLVAAVYTNAPSIASSLSPTPAPAASVVAGGATAGPSGAVGSAAPGGSLGPGVSPAPGGSGPTPVGSSGPTAGTSPIQSNFLIGQPAPRLVLPLVGGGTVDLSALKGKPVWVNFMGTYCPPCRDEFPVMNGFAVRYAETGLVVLAVDVREDEATVGSFARSLNVTFPIALDRDGSAQRTWKVVALPIHFWIDAKGIVRFGAIGGIGPDLMAKALGTILPGVDVTP